jgi:hypothetical protein
MKKMMVIGLCLISIMLLGCEGEIEFEVEDSERDIPEIIKEVAEPESEVIKSKLDPELEPKQEPKLVINKELKICLETSECEWNQVCLNGACGNLLETLSESYEIEEGCQLCNYKKIELETSDKQVLSVSPGEGSYTYAGALAWKSKKGPDYCEGEKNVLVPFQIKKKGSGKVLSDEYISVKVGETSEVLKHPTVKSLAFTLKVKSVEEVCS